MEKKKISKIFMWMFCFPVGLYIFFGLIIFILDNSISFEEKMALSQLGILFSVMWIIPWLIVCLIISIVIEYLKKIFYRKGKSNEKMFKM